MTGLAVLSTLTVLLPTAVFCYTYNYGDGSYYVGEFDDFGLPSGVGKFYNTTGKLEYRGEFYEGVPHGNGTWYGGDGSMYVGNFRYGRSSGEAVMTYATGDKLAGQFLDMRPHGKVVFMAAGLTNFVGDTQPRGKVVNMKGQFRHGMAHGHVIIRYQENPPQDSDQGSEPNEEAAAHQDLTSTIVIEGPFRMGLPHGVIKVRQSSNLSIVSEDEFDVEEGDLVAEGKFHYGRPFLDGQTKDWRSNSVLQKSLEILNRKIAF